MNFVFKSDKIMNFKYCPYCSSEILEVYPGDYAGHITCSECDTELDFYILEEVRARFNKDVI